MRASKPKAGKGFVARVNQPKHSPKSQKTDQLVLLGACWGGMAHGKQPPSRVVEEEHSSLPNLPKEGGEDTKHQTMQRVGKTARSNRQVVERAAW